jgi:spore maturation protein CgeB
MTLQIGFVFQSYLADYNFGCAHFLRGLIRELISFGHSVEIFCPHHSWVLEQAVKSGGERVLAETLAAYPALKTTYFTKLADIEQRMARLDAVLVNEWMEDAICYSIGEWAASRNRPVVLYYDTHHRVVTATHELRAAGVHLFSAVLVLAESVKRAYERRNLAKRVIVFAEAVDERMFTPALRRKKSVIWIGNYGKQERGDSWLAALAEPASRYDIATSCYGVGYPDAAISLLKEAGVFMGGWLPNVRVPRIAAEFGWMLHFPREPYSEELAGVPNIRPFEAAGLGVPLVVISSKPIGSPFTPEEHYLLFRSVEDYLGAVQDLSTHQDQLARMAQRARTLVLQGHRCRDRAERLVEIVRELS